MMRKILAALAGALMTLTAFTATLAVMSGSAAVQAGTLVA